QYAESATGWHDNLLRTYLPEHGQYLEPDPLGPWPQTQAVGYAQQQPLRHIDPTGLLLFAFDGTRQAPITKSNVWKLSQLYQDGAVHYADGPGDPVTLNWDALTAWRAGRILESQWNNFLNRMQEQGP
ncbi:RHS repeat-associated core domain-containing protein, partial [Alcaligenes pakistanensis]